MIVTSARRASSAGNPDAVPWGARLLRLIPRPEFISRYTAYRVFVFGLTYLLYITFHIVRRPLSVAKTVLHQNCSKLVQPTHWDPDVQYSDPNWCSWAPFGEGSTIKFGWLDFSYRFSYAIGMVFSGHLGERMDLRLFLTAVMLISGLWVIFGGMAFFWSVHSYSYFVVAQVCMGVTQCKLDQIFRIFIWKTVPAPVEGHGQSSLVFA